MAPQPSTSAEIVAAERRILDGLVDLYEEERRLYRRVLELTHRQGELVRSGRPFGEVRAVLEEKKDILESINLLDRSEQERKSAWQRGREHWTAAGRKRLHDSLATVAAVIEEIVTCEERNDLELIARAQEM
ncbi:MAG: hypothetical protein GY838_06960 [bacterium]|nr:hypothetical protein [bacterium]